jgi:coenzyme F420-reducing hydrogenase delta subunit
MSKSATIVVFVCNWDGLSCIETAAQKRLTFPSCVKIIRVSCLSRVHSGLMLRAFEFGAKGVILLGCDSHNCHFGIDEDFTRQNFEKAQAIMRLLGLKPDRLSLIRLSHGDASGFIRRVNEFVDQFTDLKAKDTIQKSLESN